MKILVTGAGGFLGRGMIAPFVDHGHSLRLMDVVPFESPHEVVLGNVADYQQVEAAMRGVDGLVIAHMAPRGVDNINYKTPKTPFDINVTGTANLFHAAQVCGVRHVVVISSGVAVDATADWCLQEPKSVPLRSVSGYYGVTKICQEIIAEQFARMMQMQVACLRVGYVLDGEANVDKYGHPVCERNYMDTDRRDIGEVARLCLERDDLGYEVFTVLSTQEALERTSVRYTSHRLGWKPRYDFSWLREPTPPKKES